MFLARNRRRTRSTRVHHQDHIFVEKVFLELIVIIKWFLFFLSSYPLLALFWLLGFGSYQSSHLFLVSELRRGCLSPLYLLVFMSQQRQSKMVGANNVSQFGDTTYTKIFVGGLAWETQRDGVKRYFEQFGEILEAVVIIDKNTGRSKGYGFVTFKNPDSAMRACQNPYPVIDGRRANCNLAAFGAQENYPNTPQRGMEKFRPPLRTMAPAPFQGTSTYFHQHIPQYSFPYSAYGYPGYPQDMLAMNYYNVYGGQQQLPSYYAYVGAGSPGVYNYYPFQAQHGHSTSNPLQHNPKRVIQHPYLPQQHRALGGLQFTTSVSPSSTSTTENSGTATIAAAGVPGSASEQNSSA